MATKIKKQISVSSLYRGKKHKRNKGIYSKTKQSKNKNSKNYFKVNRGQGQFKFGFITFIYYINIKEKNMSKSSTRSKIECLESWIEHLKFKKPEPSKKQPKWLKEINDGYKSINN